MYNLNVNVSAAGTAVNNLLAVESACTTPRTPEILNSLIAMTNPLDNYSFGNETVPKAGSCLQNINNDSNSSCSTQGENSTSPPSIQHTCSQLIKAGLKLSIESKRKHSADNDDFLDLDLNAKRVRKSECTDDDGDRSLSPSQGLTPEDEERRRRRRERNKIAATKCRLKKREKTVNLVQESEILETQNIDLKTQIQELESQRRRLVDMLTLHTPSCMKHHNNSEHFNQSRDGRFIVTDEENQNYSPDGGPLPPVTSLSTSVIESNHAYNRSASVDIGPTFRSQNLEFCSRPASVGISENNFPTTRTNNIQYAKPPTIIIEGDSYSPPSQLTNLDNSGISYHYNTQQCHNYNSPNSTNQNYSSSTMDNGCMA